MMIKFKQNQKDEQGKNSIYTEVEYDETFELYLKDHFILLNSRFSFEIHPGFMMKMKINQQNIGELKMWNQSSRKIFAIFAFDPFYY